MTTPAPERVAVVGLWHLGSVTSACLASLGTDVVGFDPDDTTVSDLAAGRPPVAEPGLAELVERMAAAGRLRFTSDRSAALEDAAVVWVTFDTPVDDDDHADSAPVIAEIDRLIPLLAHDATLIVSSQLPVGSARRVESRVAALRPSTDIGVACVPENLQLGRALDAFLHPPRVVVGVRGARDRDRVAALLDALDAEIVWTTPESAEMSKHALNAWLATSVAYTNEVARLCEQTGARADEVEQALRSDPRIGARAYVHAGAAFAGGTLARDLAYLRELGAEHGMSTPLLDGVAGSNALHMTWAEQVIADELGDLQGIGIAVLGLTYKPGTDTLRRSASVELCRTLASRGAAVRVHDPAARELPADLAVTRVATAEDAVRDARVVVIATPWPEYAELARDHLVEAMAAPALVVDAAGLRRDLATEDPRVVYRTVGRTR
ncbi:MAG TPA: nucleotide sugar dehydrogenase [Acidimicrobiia bacterium]